jgi:pimeloyl-ACP methyl ester carboxylesterase
VARGARAHDADLRRGQPGGHRGRAGEAARANPAAYLLKIPDAGHMVFWDNPSAAIRTRGTVLGDTPGAKARRLRSDGR